MKTNILSILVLLLSACSASMPRDQSSNQPDLDIESAQKGELDISAERNSEAIRRFLMAELSMNAERTDDALDDLRASSRLVGSPEPQIQINLAQLYISRGELKQALEELKSIKDDPEAQAMRAAILQSTGANSEALLIYRQILDQRPQYIEANLMLALDALQRKDASSAQLLLEKVITTDNKNLPALKLLAHSYRDLAKHDKAIKVLEDLRQLDLGDEHSLELLLLEALENERYDLVEKEILREEKINRASPLVKAFRNSDWKNAESDSRRDLITNLNADVNILPSYSDIRYELARFFLLKQNYVEAVNNFSLLLAEKPANDELRYTLALALSSSGRMKEASAHLQKIDSSSVWFEKAQAFSGMLYRQRGDFKRAEESFRKALGPNPKSEQLQFYLAATLREAGKLDGAEKVYIDLLEQNPKNQTALFNYGVLLHEMKKTSESHEILQRVIALNPQHAEALNFIAFDLAESGEDLERALDLANRALQVNPESGFFLDTRGWVYFKMEQMKDAISDLERAVDLTKGDAEITEHLADVYLKVGRNNEALQVYKDALDNLVDSNEEQDKNVAQRIRKKIDNITKAAPQTSK